MTQYTPETIAIIRRSINDNIVTFDKLLERWDDVMKEFDHRIRAMIEHCNRVDQLVKRQRQV